MEMNGADIVVRCLADEGVEHVFGYPGGAVLYIYDARDGIYRVASKVANQGLTTVAKAMHRPRNGDAGKLR